MVITDHINKLEAVVTYNPKPENSTGVFKGLKNKLFKSKSQSEQLSDFLSIQILQKAFSL